MHQCEFPELKFAELKFPASRFPDVLHVPESGQGHAEWTNHRPKVGSRSIRPVRSLCGPRNCRPAGDCRDWRQAIAAADLRRALAAADRAFKTWRKVSAYDRGKVLRKAGDLLRSRAEAIASVMTREQGKPRAEARGEVASGANILDWFAEEARRTYGRVIPARSDTVQQIVTKEPVGPIAAFTP
jgi:hypothetical protein